MLINLFDDEGRKVVPSAACYAIPWLKKIMDDFPDTYVQVYSYIFFTTCPDGSINPYININEEDREDLVIADLKPLHFSLEHPTVVNALKRCAGLYETPTLRAQMGAKIMLDQMADELRTKKMTYGRDGNSNDLRAMMDKMPVYIKNYMEIENLLKEEQAKVKGDRIIPFHQKEGYKETKNYEKNK